MACRLLALGRRRRLRSCRLRARSALARSNRIGRFGDSVKASGARRGCRRNLVGAERPVHRFVLWVLAAGVFSVPCFAQAQSGSMGGSVGKTEKSISGSGESAPDRRPPPRTSSMPPKQVTAASLEGNWDWEASCTTGQWQGGMTLHAVSATAFSGEFNKGHVGSVNGTINGNRLSFIRTWMGIIRQNWSAPVTYAGSSLRMQGPFTDPIRSGCRFSATKG